MATSFGTLDTFMSHANPLYAAGCRRAMQEWKWREYETSEGTFPISATQVNKCSTLKAAGLDVVLSMGLHYSPSWIKTNADIPTYVNQAGTVSNAVNIIFSADVRAKVDDYLARIAQDFSSLGGLNAFSQIRITSGANSYGELMYPQEGGYSYWAFDSAALTGNGLAAGQTPNPYPSWTPGTAPTGQVNPAVWADWYVTSLANSAKYLMDKMNSLGFTGTYALLMPGSGLRPSAYTSAVNNNCPVGNLLGAGVAWQMIVQKLSTLPYKDRIGIHCSSTGDRSGNNDFTLPTDITTYGSNVANTAMNGWSAARWMTFLSNVYGLQMGGENTGYTGGASDSFKAYYTDTTREGIMNKSMLQVKNGAWDWFDWAHSSRLFDNTQYLANYQNYIREVNQATGPVRKIYHLSSSNVWKRAGE